MACSTAQFFCSPPWGPGEGKKCQILNFNYNVNFKDFKTIFCVSSHNERYITHQTGFSWVAWVMSQGWDLRVLGGGGSKFYFPEHGHVAYQIKADDQ